MNVHTQNGEEDGITEESKFMRIIEADRKIVEMYQQKFICISEQDLKIHGSYNSEAARLLNVSLLRCDPE